MIAYFDMFSGISGDMILGAFIDLGVPAEWIEQKLSSVLNNFQIKTRTVKKNQLKATAITVETVEKNEVSRNYKDIKILIQNTSLPEKIKEQSQSAFKKIARAESQIHNIDIEKIHFHEIGGIDSIVDIIGSFLCIEYLGIKKIFASQVPLGSGSVICSHGKIPVPVPATLAILKDIPVSPSDAQTEIVTPTGAAIISTLASSFGTIPEMVIKRTGYGSGKKDTGSSLPNLLRIVLGEPVIKKQKVQLNVQKETIYIVKTNIDDMNPEISGYLMETLFDNQALDVCYTPVQMKKNRPGLQVEILCRYQELENIIHIVLTETTSIGVRYHQCNRYSLVRKKAIVETRFGKLQVKKTEGLDSDIHFIPEYEVVKELAKRKKIPLKDVYNQILSDANPLDRD